jgi:hypothetical protein
VRRSLSASLGDGKESTIRATFADPKFHASHAFWTMSDVSLAIRLQVDPGVGAAAVEMNPEETTTGGFALVSSRIRIGSDVKKITSHRIAPRVC